MLTTIRDREALGSVRPVDLIGYLRASGWTRLQDIADKASIWARPTNSDTAPEVVVPLRRETSDFALRMSEVLGTLENFEGRSQESILQDLAATSSDLVRVRSFAADAFDGTLPLDIGVSLVEQGREMLLAAACAAVTPRSYWARRKPARAVEFLKAARMGQSERGSYVLTIHCPVPPALRTETPADAPFERQVTDRLMRSLSSVREASRLAVETGDMQPFRAAVDEGVSANLCDALAGLGRISPSQGIEISISWSTGRPFHGDRPARVILPADYVPVLEEASRLFKETEPQEDFELLGLVERLDRPVGARTGQVTVSTLIGESPHLVWVELGDPEYQRAVQAHRDFRPVSCLGDLLKSGRSYRLLNPRRFELLNAPAEHV